MRALAASEPGDLVRTITSASVVLAAAGRRCLSAYLTPTAETTMVHEVVHAEQLTSIFVWRSRAEEALPKAV